MQVDSESWSLKVSVMPGRKLISGFLAAAALFCSLLPGQQAAEASASEVVTVAVSDTLLDAEAHEGMKALLARQLPQDWLVNVVPIQGADIVTGIEKLRPDFVLAAADLDQCFREQNKTAPFRVATRKTTLAADAARSAGALFVVRADRDDIKTLADLKGKTVAATLPTSLPGWLAAEDEVRRAGFDPATFFAKTLFLNAVYPNVVSALLNGAVDAAVFPACALERLHQSGAVLTDALKVVGEKTDGALACRRSTALFPDVSLWGFEWTSEKSVRGVAVALLTAPAAQTFEWLSFVPHGSVDALYQALKIGPYSYLRDYSLKGLYNRYSGIVHAALLVLVILIAYEIRLQVLVRRRTAQLSEALKRRDIVEEEARLDRERLGSLERRNIVSQMSAMIAHEVKTPVGAICNFRAILGFVLPADVKEEKTVHTALEGIQTEAERIAGIVNRVRSYAKSQKLAHTECDLAESVRRTVRSMKSSLRSPVPVTVSVPEHAPVIGDALELELLVFNLLKNAAEALEGTVRPAVAVTLAADDEGNWRLEVTDNGPYLTDEKFSRLQSLMQSVKPEGLGLGLSIVRGIADSHGATLTFERRPSGGLTVRFVTDAAPEKHQEKKNGEDK